MSQIRVCTFSVHAPVSRKLLHVSRIISQYLITLNIISKQEFRLLSGEMICKSVFFLEVRKFVLQKLMFLYLFDLFTCFYFDIKFQMRIEL